MPNSRRRKKQVMASRRQLEKNRRKVSQREAEGQENRAVTGDREAPGGETAASKSWWDWCTSGVSQVRLLSGFVYCDCGIYS